MADCSGNGTHALELTVLRELVWVGHAAYQRAALTRLTPDVFADDAHRALFEIVAGTFRRHGHVDPYALHSDLARWSTDTGRSVGDIAGTAPAVPDLLGEYVAQLLSAARARRVAEAAKAMQANPDQAERIARSLLDDDALTVGGPADLILDADAMRPDFDRALAGGHAPGVTTGLVSLDDHYTIARGQITVWTGIPSHGKSTVVDAFAVKLAAIHDWRACFWTPESWPYGEHHLPRLVQRYVGRPYTVGPTPPMSSEQAEDGFAWVTDRFAWIDPTPSRDLEIILAAADIAMRRRPFDLLVIDPFTELARPRDQRLHDFVHDVLTEVDQFVQRHDVHAFVVAHPRKLSVADARKGPPSAYDIAESSHWANRADAIISVWRPDLDDNRVLLDVQKVRFRSVGKPGKVWIAFDPRTYRVQDLDPRQWPDLGPRRSASAPFETPV